MNVIGKISRFGKMFGRNSGLLFPAAGDFAIMLWMFTELCDVGSFIKGTFLIFGIIFLGSDAFHKLLKPKRLDAIRNRVWGFGSVAAVVFTICGEAIILKNQKHSHIQLFLKTSAAPKTDFGLSRNLLSEFKYGQPSPPNLGAPFIIIPVPFGKTNIDLKFSAVNDMANFFETANDEESIAEFPRMSLAFLNSDAINADLPIWHFSSGWEVNGDNAAHFNFPNLLPGAEEDAPAVFFDLPPKPDPIVASLTIRCRQMPIETFMFHIVFIHSISSTITNFNPVLDTNENIMIFDQK